MTDDHDEPIPGDHGEHDTSSDGRATDTRSVLRSVVGAGCIVLAAAGALLFSVAMPLVLDPPEVRCDFAQGLIDDANDDDEDFNDVDLAEDEEPEDLECDRAVGLASQIPTEEDGDDTASVPGESDIRTQGFIIAAIGLAQAVLGAETLRRRNRRVRNAAVLFAIAGVIFPFFGLPSLLAVGFVVYALVFSGTARDLWGRFTLGGGSRRRAQE